MSGASGPRVALEGLWPNPVSEHRPTLRWPPVAGADRYAVRLPSRLPEGGVLYSADTWVAEPRFTPPAPLAETKAIVDLSVTPVCGAQRGPEAGASFIIDLATNRRPPVLLVERSAKGWTVRWDAGGADEKLSARVPSGADARPGDETTTTSAEVHLHAATGDAVLAARRRCAPGYSEFAFRHLRGEGVR